MSQLTLIGRVLKESGPGRLSGYSAGRWAMTQVTYDCDERVVVEEDLKKEGVASGRLQKGSGVMDSLHREQDVTRRNSWSPYSSVPLFA